MEIGDKVFCVDDTIRPDQVVFTLLHMPQWVKQRPRPYTVRGVFDGDGIADGILLEELRNPPCWVDLLNTEIEPRFAKWRFRKAEPQELERVEEEEDVDISELTEVLEFEGEEK